MCSVTVITGNIINILTWLKDTLLQSETACNATEWRFPVTVTFFTVNKFTTGEKLPVQNCKVWENCKKLLFRTLEQNIKNLFKEMHMLSSRLLYKEDEIYEDALYCNMYKYLYYGVSTVLAQ